MRTLFQNALVLPGAGEAYVGHVLTQQDQIVWAAQELPPEDLSQGAQTIDASGSILMPALFNAHTHAAMTLLRGVGSDLPLQRWLFEAVFPAEEKLTPEIVYWGTMLAQLEMLRFGTAGFADSYFYMTDTLRAVCDGGMRGALCWASSPENQQRLLSAANQCTDAQRKRLRVQAAVHSEYTTDEDYVRKISDFAHTHHLAVQTHVCETQKETQDCLRRHNKTPLAYFNDLQLFDFGGIAAHCVYLTSDDRRIVKEKNIYCAHNPISNLKLASGIMPLAQALKDELPLCLGTDGCASNNNLNLFEEMRFAALLQKGVLLDPTAVAPRQVFAMATRGGALACGFENSGLILPGSAADLILVDTRLPHALPIRDPYAHIVYSAQGSDVLLTMVAGRILYRDGQYPALDKDEIFAHAREAARALA